MNLKEQLKKHDALREGDDEDKIIEGFLERREPEYRNLDSLGNLHPGILKVLREEPYGGKLYKHQCEAIEKALSGENVVLESPTASGKTLSFMVPMFDLLLKDRKARALLIYPMKSLSRDQRSQIDKFARAVGATHIESWPFDGDTDKEHRDLLKKHPPRIVITNPDTLHYSFLAWREHWETFLGSLKYVVIDEIHEYRGFFGSNVALLMRRFRHLLSLRGVSPQFFLLSATCANPEEHAENLIGDDFTSVSSSHTAFRPRRKFMFIQPKIPGHMYYKIMQIRAVKAALAYADGGKSVFVFCNTVRFVQESYREALKMLKKSEEFGSIDESSVALFVAAINPEDREKVIRDMHEGVCKVVFCTNALELGIDVPCMDGVILAGFPDSPMSAWQRIGRAGRGWNRDADVVLYAMNHPVDRFYASNLKAFLNKRFDHLIADAGNEEFIKKHVSSLLHESGEAGLSETISPQILGDEFYKAAAEAGEKMHSSISRYKPQRAVKIRGELGASYDLVFNEKKIGTISDVHRFRDAYIGAVYLYSGKTYRVEGHTGEDVRLVEYPYSHKTRPKIYYPPVEITKVFSGHGWDIKSDDDPGAGFVVKVSYVHATSSEVFSGYLLLDENDEVIDQGSAATSGRNLKSHALRIEFAGKWDSELLDGLGALEQMLRLGFMFSVPADRHDIFTRSESPKGGASLSIYLLESYEGGIGLAKKALGEWRQILSMGIDVAEDCDDCIRGCPNCLVPPRMPDDSHIDKRAGIALARKILEVAEREANLKIEDEMWQEK